MNAGWIILARTTAAALLALVLAPLVYLAPMLSGAYSYSLDYNLDGG